MVKIPRPYLRRAKPWVFERPAIAPTDDGTATVDASVKSTKSRKS